MIQKILDDYYSNQLLDLFKDWVSVYLIEIIAHIDNRYVKIYFKYPKWKDESALPILSFNKKDAIKYLLDRKATKEYFMKSVLDFVKDGEKR